MIDLKPLKTEVTRFPEPLKSIIQISKDAMSEQDFIKDFLKRRKKARELDLLEGEKR